MPVACHYCNEQKLEDNWDQLPGPNKIVLFPDGQKLNWKMVCPDCRRGRAVWEQQRNFAKLQDEERRRQWHQEVHARNEARRQEMEAKRAERELQRDIQASRKRQRDMAELYRLAAELGAEIIFPANEKST